jgi:hypothetical protein
MAVNDRNPEPSENGRRAAPVPLKKFLVKRRLDCLFHHCRLARFLTGAGFDIRRIERKDNHADVWVVHMRRGFVPWGQEVESAKVYVQTFLRRQGVRYPKREIDVSVHGDRILVAFIWKAGTPGMLIFWGGNLGVECQGKRDAGGEPRSRRR